MRENVAEKHHFSQKRAKNMHSVKWVMTLKPGSGLLEEARMKGKPEV